MLRMLREQVNAELQATAVRRKPALRRSDAPDVLFATDLLLAAELEAVNDFLARVQKMGWQYRKLESGWLLLDAPIPVPAEEAPASPDGECGCCITLLQRHQEGGDAAVMIRAVAKAAEAGRQPFERLCGQLHGQLAAMLRQHEPLPGQLLPYLNRAYAMLEDGRNTSC